MNIYVELLKKNNNNNKLQAVVWTELRLFSHVNSIFRFIHLSVAFSPVSVSDRMLSQWCYRLSSLILLTPHSAVGLCV